MMKTCIMMSQVRHSERGSAIYDCVVVAVLGVVQEGRGEGLPNEQSWGKCDTTH